MALLVLATPSQAKMEDWKDTQGKKFRGEPVEVLGPFAIFRTSKVSGRRVVLNTLAPETCVRFYEQIKDLPPRAGDWADAKAAVSQELIGNVMKLEGEKLVPVDLKGRQEPALFVVFYASSGEGLSWGMLGESIVTYNDIKQAQPGMLEGVYYGTRHTRAEHTAMARQMNIPWLATDLLSHTSLHVLSRFAPKSGFGLIVFTRDGIPIMSYSDPDSAGVKKAMAELKDLMELLKPENPAAWPARAHYLRAIQTKAYATGKCAPVMIGNPLRADALKQRLVRRFDALMKVDADHQVTDVMVQPGADMPEPMILPIADALKMAMFVTAVDNGRYVEGEYLYHFEVAK